jgi:hypothetical protein
VQSSRINVFLLIFHTVAPHDWAHRIEDRSTGVWFPAGDRFLFSSARPDELCVPSLYYPVGTGGVFPGNKAAGAVRLTIHLYLVPRSRMVELYLHFTIRLNDIEL